MGVKRREEGARQSEGERAARFGSRGSRKASAEFKRAERRRLDRRVEDKVVLV